MGKTYEVKCQACNAVVSGPDKKSLIPVLKAHYKEAHIIGIPDDYWKKYVEQKAQKVED